MANLSRECGDLDASQRQFNAAEPLLRAVNARFKLALLLAQRGLLEVDLKRLDDARQSLHDAETLARELEVEPGSNVHDDIEELRDALTNASG